MKMMRIPRSRGTRTAWRIVLVALLLVSSAHRLPAPISEAPENPTPAPAQENWKPKHSARPKRKPEEPGSTKPPPTKMMERPQVQTVTPAKRFAGTWTGKVTYHDMFVSGDRLQTFIVNETETSVQVNPKGGVGTATVSGNSLTWATGLLGEAVWILTPNADGRTARVTVKLPLGTASGTLTRGASNATSSSSESTVTEKTKTRPRR